MTHRKSKAALAVEMAEREVRLSAGIAGSVQERMRLMAEADREREEEEQEHVGIPSRIDYVSLCAGAGSLDLGVRIALPSARCRLYVEIEAYCCEILASRIEEGSLDDAPVWSDLYTFDARPWRGLIDMVVGGFPCQDISAAGKGEGIKKGNRSGLWFEFERVIRDMEPSYVFVENVPAITLRGLGTVLGGLASLGYDACWQMLSANSVGASHQRKRFWLLARRVAESSPGRRGRKPRDASSDARTPPGIGTPGAEHGRAGDGGGTVADTNLPLLRGQPSTGEQSELQRDDGDGGRPLGNPPSQREREPDDAQRPEPQGRDARQDAGGTGGGITVGHANGERSERLREGTGIARAAEREVSERSESAVVHPASIGRGEGRAEHEFRSGWNTVADTSGPDVADNQRGGCGERADATGEGLGQGLCGQSLASDRLPGFDLPLFPPGPGDRTAWQRILAVRPDLAPAISTEEEETQSAFRDLASGLAPPLDISRTDALRLLGNGCVPGCVATAFTLLWYRLTGERLT